MDIIAATDSSSLALRTPTRCRGFIQDENRVSYASAMGSNSKGAYSLSATLVIITIFTHIPHTPFPQNSTFQNWGACVKQGSQFFFTGIEATMKTLL